MPGTDEHRTEWSGLAAAASAVLAVATVCVGAALAGDAGSPDTVGPAPLSALIASGKASVEDVTFKDRPLAIRVVRGLSQTAPPRVRSEETEIVSFGPGGADRVKVVRGPAVPPASHARLLPVAVLRPTAQTSPTRWAKGYLCSSTRRPLSQEANVCSKNPDWAAGIVQ